MLRQPGTCGLDDDCPGGSTCEPSRITALAAIRDVDGDGIPDEDDNCPDLYNADQADQDDDGAGDVCASGAGAGGLSVGEKKIQIKDRDGDPSKRKLTFSSKDDAIVAPDPASGGDPTAAGGELTVRNPTTAQTATFALPMSGWKGLGKPAGAKGYKYKDKDLVNGPCKSANVKDGSMKVSCKGAQISFALTTAPQGSISAALDVGSQRYCASFSGAEVTADEPAADGGNGTFKAAGDTAGMCAVP
jgi:hypothetical protein